MVSEGWHIPITDWTPTWWNFLFGGAQANPTGGGIRTVVYQVRSDDCDESGSSEKRGSSVPAYHTVFSGTYDGMGWYDYFLQWKKSDAAVAAPPPPAAAAAPPAAPSPAAPPPAPPPPAAPPPRRVKFIYATRRGDNWYYVKLFLGRTADGVRPGMREMSMYKTICDGLADDDDDDDGGDRPQLVLPCASSVRWAWGGGSTPSLLLTVEGFVQTITLSPAAAGYGALKHVGSVVTRAAPDGAITLEDWLLAVAAADRGLDGAALTEVLVSQMRAIGARLAQFIRRTGVMHGDFHTSNLLLLPPREGAAATAPREPLFFDFDQSVRLDRAEDRAEHSFMHINNNIKIFAGMDAPARHAYAAAFDMVYLWISALVLLFKLRPDSASGVAEALGRSSAPDETVTLMRFGLHMLHVHGRASAPSPSPATPERKRQKTS